MEVLQENHYYPFGLKMEGKWAPQIGKENKYGFNGKELDDEFGLNWNMYEFRGYDPAIGRFISIDPISDAFDFQSPYAFAANNPISNIDFLGLAPERNPMAPSSSSGFDMNDPDVRREHNIVGFFSGGDPPTGSKSNPATLPSATVTASRLPSGYSNYSTKLKERDFRGLDVDGGQVLPGLPLPGKFGEALYGFFTNDLRQVDIGGIAYVVDAEGFVTMKRRSDIIVLNPPIGGNASAFKGVKMGSFNFTRHGQLTNGTYTVSKEAMKKHVVGGGPGKSIFYPTVNAEKLVLKAAEYADKMKLWKGKPGQFANKAKVSVTNTNIGTTGIGNATNKVNLYRSPKGALHGSPGN